MGSLTYLHICIFKFYFYLYMNVFMCASAQGGQEQVSDPLELEFQAVVSRLTWALGPNFSPLEE